MNYTSGYEEVGKPSRGASFDLDGISVESWERATQKLIGGTTLVAPHGGEAVALKRAAEEQPELLLTTHRLLVIEGFPSTEHGTRVTWQCAVDDVTEIRLHPRLLQAGRLFISFTDGSAVRLMAGMFSGQRAKTFAAEFQRLKTT